jgi:hypothetical protein
MAVDGCAEQRDADESERPPAQSREGQRTEATAGNGQQGRPSRAERGQRVRGPNPWLRRHPASIADPAHEPPV